MSLGEEVIRNKKTVALCNKIATPSRFSHQGGGGINKSTQFYGIRTNEKPKNGIHQPICFM